PYFKNIYDKKDIFAMTLASSFLISLSSAFMYAKNGYVSFFEYAPYLVPAAIGGAAGAFLLDKMKISFLSKLFAAIVIYAGITLFTR
ncbi:MAG: TSUP family transporter, partial [Eubacteriales bacterium]